MDGERSFHPTKPAAPETAEHLSSLQRLKHIGAWLRRQMMDLAFPEEMAGRRHFLEAAILDIDAGMYDPQIRSWWENIGRHAATGHANRTVFEEFGLRVAFTKGDILKIKDAPDPIAAIKERMMHKLDEERYG